MAVTVDLAATVAVAMAVTVDEAMAVTVDLAATVVQHNPIRYIDADSPKYTIPCKERMQRRNISTIVLYV